MPNYISTTDLQKRQNRLSLDLIDYDLSTQWHSHDLINRLRKAVVASMPQGLFDPQDLEHQVLFRLTTYAPQDINDEIIGKAIEEQLAIINHRLAQANVDLDYLFRGLSGRHRDLNVGSRLELKNMGGELVAIGNGCSFEVEFKKITDPEIINLFTEKLHYIHSGRHRGDAFGFFFKGDFLPWGVETTEPSIIAKDYKKHALLAHGIDPNKAVEITRLYLLPGSPKNAISILDGLVGRYYKDQGIEAMYTTTMPTYAKTKGATTAGGMKDVLLVKELSHNFEPVIVDKTKHYALKVSDTEQTDQVHTHSAFPTLYTVETFMRLNSNREIQPLPILQKRTIYIGNRHREGRSVVKETKFKVEDVGNCLQQLREHAQFVSCKYVRDEFWVDGEQPRIRLRTADLFDKRIIEVSRKYRLSKEQHVRTEVVENLYKGMSLPNALDVLREQGAYKPKNSYEKVSINYQANECTVELNLYPFGAYLELSGHESAIWAIAHTLGYTHSDSITMNADEIYLDWNKKADLPELLHITFGLGAV